MSTRAITAVAATLMLLATAPAPVAAAPLRAPLPGGQETPESPKPEQPEPDTGLYLVRLDKPSLAAAAMGGKARVGKPDLRSSASARHAKELKQQQDTLVDEIEATLGRPVRVAHTYRNVVNAVAVAVNAEEAVALSSLPGVTTVVPDQTLTLDTDSSNGLIQSPAVWEGRTADQVGTRGEGVIVGVLDTGINPGHPSFAAVDGDGYQHTNPKGAGNYLGVCAPAHPNYRAICNDKLIGAWSMVGTDPRDDNGHGSHTASTAAGNRHQASIKVGTDSHTLTVSGVAPRANIIAYKVCMTIGCFSSATIAAVDQAIADGVDVLNYSISGSDNPWNDLVDQAFLEAYSAGIFVAASAGNDGPDPETVAKTAPWNATVASVNHERVAAHRLDVTSPMPVPPGLTGIAAVIGEGSPAPPIDGELRYAGTAEAGNDSGCDTFPAGAFSGKVALVPRGGCNFSVKVANAATAGATGVVVYNQFNGPPITMGALAGSKIPAVMVTLDDGLHLREHLASSGPVTVHVGAGSEVVRNEDWNDGVSDFSSRGPSRFDMLAPTVAAPGRNILAATMATADNPVQYAFMQGTSMASPHVAGAGALLAALYPDWSPTRIRSALAVTADRNGVLKEDGVNPADPFDVGSGRINLDQAARTGLVLDETTANFVAADPDTGGEPQTLNLPAVVEHHCLTVCAFTRTVSSVVGATATWQVANKAPDGVRISVTPQQFTLAPGASQALTITLDVTGTPRDKWLFGSIELTTDARHASDGPAVAAAHFPIAVLPAAPDLTVEPAELTSSTLDVAETESYTVKVSNVGGAPLTWRATGEGAGCSWPTWATVTPAQGDLAPFTDQDIEITFDSTGLDDGGVFEAGLCLASNDPEQATTTISLRLTVVPVPKIEVSAGALSARQPAGLVTTQKLTVRNAGHGVLDWRLDDPNAGPSEERIELLRKGVLLIPNSSSANRGVMAFDPQTGNLIDQQFIPHVPYDPTRSLYTPFHIVAKPDGTGFLMSDQVNGVVTEYTLDGRFRRVFAPRTGASDPAIMTNTRGIALSPRGTVLVTVASQANANSVVEFDADGNYLGKFVAPGADGLKGPWGILFRENDMLISASDSDAIHSFSKDGSQANPRFYNGLSWPGQMVELPDGNVLVANWGSGGPAGIYEMDSTGKLVGTYAPARGSGYQGVYQLGNGNILVTSSRGVEEIDRTNNLVSVKNNKGAARFITHVRMPDLQPCVTPDEVPWLSVDPGSAGTGAGRSSEVMFSLDSTGLAAGTYRAQLCVTSDDPSNPLVSLPVTMEVTDQTCAKVVSGEHRGALTMRTGTTCLAQGAEVLGPVNLSRGAGLFALDASVTGPVSTDGAGVVELIGGRIDGPVSVTGTTGRVLISGITVIGPVSLVSNRTADTPAMVSGNEIDGPLHCVDNQPPPVNNGVANTVSGPKSGQCAGL